MLKKLLVAAVAALVIAAVISALWLRRPRPQIVIADLPDERVQPRCDREQRVETPDQLEQVLRSDFVGCVIVTKNKFLNMTGRAEIPVKDGVKLMGERGELGSRPSLFTDAQMP